MSFAYIKKNLDALGVFSQGMMITLDQQFLGSAELIDIFKATLDQDQITIKTYTWENQDDHIRLTGYSDLLNVEQFEVDLSIAEQDGEALFTMVLKIAKGWTFGASFQEMPLLMDFSEDTIGKDTLLDTLSLGASKLILTNQSHHHADLDVDLLPGLNFAGEVYFMGPLASFTGFSKLAGPIKLSGPINEYRRTPDPLAFKGIRLSAPIPLDIDFGALKVNKTQLTVKSPLREKDVDYSISWTSEPGIYIYLEMEIAGRQIEIMARYENTGSACLDFFGRFTDFDIAGMHLLTDTVGGDDLQSSLPRNMDPPSGLRITEFGFSLDLDNKSVDNVFVALGTQTAWVLMEDMITLEEVGIQFGVAFPFNKNLRSLSASLSGTFKIGQAALALKAGVPDLLVQGALAQGSQISLGNLAEKYIAGVRNVPDWTISKLYFSGDAKQRNFEIACTMQDLLSFPVGKAAFQLEQLAFYLSYSRQGSSGAFSALMTLGDAMAEIEGTLGSDTVFMGNFTNVSLTRLYNDITGGGALPDEIPEIMFDYLSMTYNITTKDFELKGKAVIAYDKLPFEGSITTDIEVMVVKSGSADYRLNLSLTGTGPVGFADGFSMNSFNLLFNYQTKGGWSLSGQMDTTLFDTKLVLTPGYTALAGSRQFTLTAVASPAIKIISLDGVGYYSLHQLDLKIERKELADKKHQSFWNLRVDSTLAIDHVMTISGYLNLFNDADGRRGLVFNPAAGTAVAAIDFPGGDGAGVDISLFEVGFVKESGGGWTFTGTTDVKFKGLPGWMGQLLPSTLHAKLVAGANAVSISAVRVTDALPIVLPEMNGRSMGTIYFQLTEVGIALKPAVGLVLEAGMGFSKEVNNLFGGHTIFRVYEAGNVATLARTRLTIGESGIAAQFVSSPFAGANAVVVNGESWFDVDLGDCGALRLKMPTFKYDGVTQYFEAGGGAEVTRPLAVPLEPIKKLLEGVKLKAAADALPASIPVKGVNIVDQHGDFKIDELIRLLESAGDIPGEVKEILRATGDLLDRFPDTFKQYFNITVPEKLEFKFGFSPTGRITFGLKTGETPIRILQSTMVPGIIPMPGLNGIELREISLGTLMAGSLFQLTIDGHVDTYDFGTLALSLALPSNKSFPLPTSNELQRRLVLNNVFMIIPLQEGVPIPIPIFYDCIGLEHMGIEGVGLQAHLGFPAPKLSGLVEFFSTLKQFFADRDYLLDPSTPPGIDLTFNLGDNYIQLPEYLGGKVLGLKGKPQSTSAWSGMAHALNFMKTVSLNELIQSIPLENRVGSAEHTFAFLRFDADWLVTTPQEFRDGAFTQLKLTAGDRDDFMAVLPAVASGNQPAAGRSEQGLVVFLRGEVDVSVVGLEVVFGLAASGSMGFNTGFKMTGTIANFMALQLGGLIEVNPHGLKTRTGSVVELAGYTYLDFGSHRAFEGDIRITEKGFEFRGNLDLFPRNLPLKATGTLEGSVGSKGFYLAGDVQTALAGLDLLNARAIISDKQVLIEGSFLGVTASLEVWQEADALALRGAVGLNLWGFKAQASIYINSDRGAVVQGDVDEINLAGLFKLTGAAGKPKASFYMDFTSGKAPVVDISGAVVLLGLRSETQVRVGDGGFAFKTTGKIFNLFEVELDVSGGRLDHSADFSITATMRNDLFAYLKDNVSKAIKAAADEATASITKAQHDLDKAQGDVNSLNNQIKKRRAQIEKGRADAKNKLASAQSAVTGAQNKVNSLNREIKDKEAERDRQSKKQACTTIKYWVPTPKWNNPLKGHWDHKRTCVPDPGGLAKAAKLQAEITGLYTALGTATAGLAAAKAALKLAEGAVDVTPIEADPQLAGLYTAKETATAGLTVAKGALQGAKEAVGAVASVGDFITRYGLGGLLDVRSATFQAGLKAASGGQVALAMQLDFMGKSQKFDFNFNFHDPLASAKALAKKLLPG